MPDKGVDELERLTIAAVREHRQRLRRAETAHENWRRSEAREEPAERRADLRRIYDRELLMTRSQQLTLDALVDELGHVPLVSETRSEEAAELDERDGA
jgi:hypothetical protein